MASPERDWQRQVAPGRRHGGRHALGIELNEDYCRIAADRLAQQSLLTGEWDG